MRTRRPNPYTLFPNRTVKHGANALTWLRFDLEHAAVARDLISLRSRTETRLAEPASYGKGMKG